MNVHHTGPYTIEIYGWDGQNNIFNNNIKSPYEVWNKFPTIFSYFSSGAGAWAPSGSPVSLPLFWGADEVQRVKVVGAVPCPDLLVAPPKGHEGGAVLEVIVGGGQRTLDGTEVAPQAQPA